LQERGIKLLQLTCGLDYIYSLGYDVAIIKMYMTKIKKLTKKEKDEIKKHLLVEKEVLIAELSKIAKVNPHNPDDYEATFEDYGDDETDNTSEVVKYGLNLTLEKTLEKSLKDVNKSLDRIEKDEYGTCKYCEQPIEQKRLLARPTSSACITCKTKLKSL
jgi:RNA polymerase-binding protein DksA